jgi:hypothetical protein
MRIYAKRLKILIETLIVFAVFLCSCQMPPNGETTYYHISLVIDETNMYKVIGFMDYVFIGTVEKINKKIIVGGDDPREYYSVKVSENLKGTLFTETDIEVVKKGGYLKDGTLVLYASDEVIGTGLCEVKKKYIFMGCGQQNGDILLDYLYGNVEYNDKKGNDYLNYINYQIDYKRERFLSRYDPGYRK